VTTSLRNREVGPAVGQANGLVELCQYTFLLRLMALMAIGITGTVPHTGLGYSVTAVSYLVALVCALTWRRLFAVVAAHPLFAALDVGLSVAGVAVGGDNSAYWLLSLGSPLLIGLVYRALPATLLALLMSSGYLAAVGLTSGHESLPAGRALLYPGVVLAASLVRVRVLALGRAREEVMRHAARLEERGRLAREMHDSVVKTLHGIALTSHALATAPPADDEDLRGRLQVLTEAAEQGAQEARRLLVQLRTDQADRSFVAVVRDLVDDVAEVHGLASSVDVDGVADVDGPARYELLAATREALENVVRHSGAGTVAVVVRGDREVVEVRVTDDGHGFDLAKESARARRQGHFGLTGIEERMRGTGGRADVETAPGAGTTVSLRVPRRA
jgi:signal transduction histidine kinase